MSIRHQNRWSLPAQASIARPHPGVTMRSPFPDIEPSYIDNHRSDIFPHYGHSRIPSHITKPTDIPDSEETTDPFALDSDDELDPRLEKIEKMHHSIYHYIPSIDQLSFDGRNLHRWSKSLDLAIYNMLNLRHYFASSRNTVSSIGREEDKLVVRLIYETIPESIKDHIDKLDNYPSAFEIFKTIRSLFEDEETNGRTAQINTWTRLLNQRFDRSVHDLTEHINRINLIMDKLDSQGFTWTKDSMAGILYQLTVPIVGGWNLEGANRRLDLRWSRDKSPFRPEEIIRAMQSEVNIKKNIHGASDRPITRDNFAHIAHQQSFDRWICTTLHIRMNQDPTSNIAGYTSTGPLGSFYPRSLVPIMNDEPQVRYAPPPGTSTHREKNKKDSNKVNGLDTRITEPYTSSTLDRFSTDSENDESEYPHRGVFDNYHRKC